ncbi:hypothetical protein Tco_0905024 [Tanacetum coccineum]
MLEKSMYDSWAIRIRLFIKGKKNGRMMLDLIDNGPLVYPTVEENRQTRPKKYSELTEAQQLQDDCDVQAINIILHGLPSNMYALVNHQEAAKDIWDRVKLLMKGTELSYQERECRLYNLFDKFAYVQVTQQSQAEFPQLDSGLVVPTFQQRKDPINCINKAMAFLYAVASRGIAKTSMGNYAVGQAKIVKCYNCLGERHMTKQCTQPMRPRSSAWFKEKLMLAEAQEAAFQTEDLDAYDSDCDDISSAKVILMANLSSCESDVLSEVPYSDTYLNDMINQDVQEMSYSKQTHIVDFSDNEITSDNNIISYSQYLQESQNASIQYTNSSTPNDLLVLSLVEQMTDHVANLDKKIRQIKCVIAKVQAVISVIDDEETLILEEDSRSKMLDKQNDVISIEKKINISPIEYSKLNKIKEDFGKHFVTQKELSAEQAFWLKHSNYNLDTSIKSHTPVRIEAPSELPKVVKKRTTYDALTADEITEVQTVFNQMEAAVDQCSVDKNTFEIQIKQLSIDNDQLLKQIMSQEIMHIHVNSVDILIVNKSCVDECNKCLELETELIKKKDLIEKDVYNKLLKTQSQEKDTVIRKLKDEIKSLSGKDSVKNVKKDIDEIETINIELEHSVAKLLSKNENLIKEREDLKSIYKDQ